MLRGYKVTDVPGPKTSHRHEVLFYPDDVVFLDSCINFITAVLGAGDVAAVVAAESHRDSLFERLKAEGFDVDAEIKRGRYVSWVLRHRRSPGRTSMKDSKRQLGITAAACPPLVRRRNSASGTTNCVVPQSEQIVSSGNTQTCGL